MNGTVEADIPQQPVDTQPVNHGDVQIIAQTIRDLASTEVQVVRPVAEGENGAQAVNSSDFGITSYWDAPSMAPLNARSAVSTMA
jgi:hypothetical protein